MTVVTGESILFRLKTKIPGPFHYGYVIRRSGNLVQIGPYNGASDGPWYEEFEIESRKYPR